MIDMEVERAIDEAGRELIFERARRLGWSAYSPPPKWVWVEIARTVKAGEPSGMPPQRLDEALLGVRLF